MGGGKGEGEEGGWGVIGRGDLFREAEAVCLYVRLPKDSCQSINHADRLLLTTGGRARCPESRDHSQRLQFITTAKCQSRLTERNDLVLLRVDLAFLQYAYLMNFATLRCFLSVLKPLLLFFHVRKTKINISTPGHKSDVINYRTDAFCDVFFSISTATGEFSSSYFSQG